MRFALPELLLAERAGRAAARAWSEPSARIVIDPGLAGAAACAAARHLANQAIPIQIELVDLHLQSPEFYVTLFSVIAAMGLPVQHVATPRPGREVIDGTVAGISGEVGLRLAPKTLPPCQAWGIDSPLGTDPLIFPPEAPSAIAPRDAFEMREIDQRASEEFDLPSLALMENAGIGALRIAWELLGGAEGMEPGPVLILVGPGNNGGDGLVVARGLIELGVPVTVLSLTDPAALKGDAGANRDILLAGDHLLLPLAEHLEEIPGARLIVDALFGTGLARPLEGLARTAVEQANASGHPILALDLPSGRDADTGRVLGAAIRPGATVTFAAPKLGLTPKNAGDLWLAGIGCPALLLESS